MELKYDSPGSAVSGLTQKYFTTFCTVRTSLEDCSRHYMIDLHKKGHLVSVCVELWLLAVFVSTMHVCVCLWCFSRLSVSAVLLIHAGSPRSHTAK